MASRPPRVGPLCHRDAPTCMVSVLDTFAGQGDLAVRLSTRRLRFGAGSQSLRRHPRRSTGLSDDFARALGYRASRCAVTTSSGGGRARRTRGLRAKGTSLQGLSRAVGVPAGRPKHLVIKWSQPPAQDGGASTAAGGTCSGDQGCGPGLPAGGRQGRCRLG
jgi:hypothetical protein